MNRAAFFADLRASRMFGVTIRQSQVEGIEAILDECRRLAVDLPKTAYILATAFGETGGRMQPVQENLNYSAARIPQVFSAARRQGKSPAALARNPELLANTVYGGNWGAAHLGNIAPDDGWRYRGRGIGQITGRRNYAKWAARIDPRLIDNPDLMMTLDMSVRALVQPMIEGWATGRKLSDYIEGNRIDFIGARRVWNGTFEAETYARRADMFRRALVKGGWTVSVEDHHSGPEGPQEPPKADWAPTLAKPAQSPWAGIFTALAAIFRRSVK